MKQYRKKPLTVDAVQVTDDNLPVLLQLARDAESGRPLRVFPKTDPVNQNAITGVDFVSIGTLEGTLTADHGDWIIRGIKGELYPCKPDIFALTYEEIPSAAPGAVSYFADARVDSFYNR